jgi:hypothetical protein
VWADVQDRRHLARACHVEGLLLMAPLDHELEAVAMDVGQPHPWRRVEWGGHD